MITMETQLAQFRPVINYENTLGRTSLSLFRFIFLIIWVSCLVGIYFSADNYTQALLGSTLIFFALWLEQVLLYCYHNSFYFRGFDSVIGSGGKKSAGIAYEVAQTLLRNEADITDAFFTSRYGQEIILRCGISISQLNNFLESNRSFLPAIAIPLSQQNTTTLFDITSYIYMYDVEFKKFFKDNAVSQTIFDGATTFVLKQHDNYKRTQRWWGRDCLSLHPKIGRGLSTGTPFELQKFAYELPYQKIYIDGQSLTNTHEGVVTKIEHTLARDLAANILLLGESGSGHLDILSVVRKRAEEGDGLNALAGLSFWVLDTTALCTQFSNPNDLEREILTLLNQVAQAGNLVIVIPHISSFMSQLSAVGIIFTELIDIYLSIPTIHFVCLDTASQYHKHLHNESAFVSRFEEIVVESSNTQDTITILEPIILLQERRQGIFFTYDAITQIAICADRYIAEGIMPDRAISVLHGVISHAKNADTKIITSDIVFSHISKVTGIPVGPITEDERDKLLHLEQVLHERVVGQDMAVTAIARTMRRARVNIERADKPIGTFLFLGPTGVGKTETAKALAYTFFGDESKMIRFDMSEFSGAGTLGKLLGGGGTDGILAEKIHAYPYCVILLDEFEKASTNIHDLFLQILDEGYFTNASGKKIDLRNTIIIATSNAGGRLIFKTSSIRAENPNLDSEIINHIINENILRPELINRFDSTIIFEPLDETEQGKVADILLRDLTSRVEKQGYYLQITPELKRQLTEQGYSPEFGGRGMGRIIQDVVEEKIAQKIISGEVVKGGTIILTDKDF